MSKLTIMLNNGDVDTVIGEIEIDKNADLVVCRIYDKIAQLLKTRDLYIPRPTKKVWQWERVINGVAVYTKNHTAKPPTDNWYIVPNSEKEIEG